MKRLLLVIGLLATGITIGYSQNIKTDTTNFSLIKSEALNHSQTLDNLSVFCAVNGSRLMWSPQYRKSADWIKNKLAEWGITNTYYEDINRQGKSWELKKFYAVMTEPYAIPIAGNPKEWTPGTNGTIKSEVVQFKVKGPEDFEKYKGKLQGKIVLLTDMFMFRPFYGSFVNRFTDDSLKVLEGYKIPDAEQKKLAKEEEEKTNASYKEYFTFLSKKVEFCQKEGAVLLIDPGYRYYGLNQVWANSPSLAPKDAVDYLSAYAGDPNIPESLPQITISMEQYNNIVRILDSGKPVTMEANIEVGNYGVEKGFNVIAEIPGTELKNEVVMVGAHLDSYSFAVGATDNAASVVNCMEVLRLIKSLGLQPKRTIRIGIWGAEEEGLIGSKAHIEKHFIKGNEKLYSYFNMDFGAGRYRGIYAEENTGAAEVFKEWMKIIGDGKFQTVCMMKVKNSDQEAFSDAGLSGFAFIQDPLDYNRIYHTNMDFVERIYKDDITNNSFLMTAMAWLSANAEGNFPVRAVN